MSKLSCPECVTGVLTIASKEETQNYKCKSNETLMICLDCGHIHAVKKTKTYETIRIKGFGTYVKV